MAGALRRGAPRSVLARVGRPFTAGARRAFSQVVFDTAFKALQRERVAAVRARLEHIELEADDDQLRGEHLRRPRCEEARRKGAQAAPRPW